MKKVCERSKDLKVDLETVKTRRLQEASVWLNLTLNMNNWARWSFPQSLRDHLEEAWKTGRTLEVQTENMRWFIGSQRWHEAPLPGLTRLTGPVEFATKSLFSCSVKGNTS